MPYPNEHSARIRDPNDFIADSFRSKSIETGIRIIIGKLKNGDGSMVTQAYRFKSDQFTVAEAKKWLKDHDIKYISFEAATGESKSIINEETTMYIDNTKIERRCLPTAEIRLDGTEDAPKIIGYAAVFNTWADIGGWFKESIRPGAFTKTINENDIRALKNHNEDHVLGRNKAKPSPTLALREDSKGLAIEILPPDTTYANDLLKSMRRGDMNQMSFGFQVNKQEVDYDKNERVLIDVTLFDVSVVTFPAYPTTSAQVRSLFHIGEADKSTESQKWEEFDRIIGKIKAGEELTEEEIRALTVFIPNLSMPPAQHIETIPEPPAKHSVVEPRKVDKWMELYIRAEVAVPTNN